jgi:hypothetical protein
VVVDAELPEERLLARSDAVLFILRPLRYALHESVLRRVVRFSQAIVYMSNFHSVLHLSGKGMPFTFEQSALPAARMNNEQLTSLELFDQRIQFDQYPLTRLGTQGL